MKRERRSRAPISNLSDPAVCAVLIALGARVSTSSSTQENYRRENFRFRISSRSAGTTGTTFSRHLPRAFELRRTAPSRPAGRSVPDLECTFRGRALGRAALDHVRCRFHYHFHGRFRFQPSLPSLDNDPVSATAVRRLLLFPILPAPRRAR